MADLFIRHLDASVLQGLMQRAASRGHSLEDEVRCVLSAAVKFDPTDRAAAADRLRRRTLWIPGTDSTELVRTERDR